MNNGISIIDFSPDLDRVGGDTTINIDLLVENVGEGVASFIIAELVGLDDWTISTSTPREQRLVTTNTLKPNELAPTDFVHGIKGEQGLFTWTVTSPKKQFDQNYDFSVKVSYTYITKSTILLQAVGLNYFKTLSKEQQAELQQGIISVSTTQGPFEVSAKTQSTFLGQSTTLPVEIEIKNVGSGRTFYGPGLRQVTRESLDIVLVDVKAENTRCSQQLRLSSGKSGKFVCRIDTTNVDTIKTVSLDVTLTYSYFIEKISSITVLKSLEQLPSQTPTQVPDECKQCTSDQTCEFDAALGGWHCKEKTVSERPVVGTNFGETNFCENKIKSGQGQCVHGEGGCKSDSECDSRILTDSGRLKCKAIVGISVNVCCYERESDDSCKSAYNVIAERSTTPVR